MADGIEVALLKGIAAELGAASGLRVDLTYRPTGNYTANELGIYVGVKAEGVNALTLATYPVSDDIAGEDTVIGVQFRFTHSDRAKMLEMAADVSDRYNGRRRGMLGAVQLVTGERTSGTDLNQDRNDRLERTDNYYLRVVNATAIRL